jgi:AcrR family transcriptional regulator
MGEGVKSGRSRPPGATPARRPYSSTVRAEGARRTRAAIVEAATELFLGRGYDGTSLADVAEAAGVSRPTVTSAFGAKAALLSRVLDQALAGDDDPVPVRDRPWFRPVWEATTPGGVLDAYADVCLVIGGRAGHVIEAVRRASDSAPEAAELWESFLRTRRAGAAMVVEHELVAAALRPGLTVRTAGDVLWTLNDPDLYVSLVERQGWSPEAFRSWLADSMRTLLLDDDAG